MFAVKGNRQYTISELEVNNYKSRGYDILDEDGTVIKHGDGKTVTYAKYEAVLQELEALKQSKDEGLKAEIKAVKAELAKSTKALADANAELDSLKKTTT